MVKVIKYFRDSDTNKIYKSGDEYSGKHENALLQKGFAEPSVEYKDMKVDELKTLLEQKGIEYTTDDRKKDLIKKLEV